MQTMKGLLSVIGLTLVVSSFGQSTTDHPNLKSGNARTGANGNVAASGPGYLRVEGVDTLGNRLPSALRWFTPLQSAREVDSLRLNEINPFRTRIDNTDYLGAGAPGATNLDESATNVGPYDPLPNGFVSSLGLWNTPDSDHEAQFPLDLYVRRNRNAANPVAFQERNYTQRFPSHTWQSTTSSAAGVGGDPRIAAVPGNLRTWTWTFQPMTSTQSGVTFTPVNDLAPKDYALYVWIPQGPVKNAVNVNVFQARYQVYEITYGVGQKYVDVVDTWRSGAGWVRLGNGGGPTNQVFPYAGNTLLNPLRITLYNTIPRNNLDQLMEEVTVSKPDNRFCVLADAAQFSTETNGYMSTPTSAGFGTADVRVTGALNERLVDPTTLPAIGDYKSKPFTVAKGVLTSYDYNTGNVRWKYSPLETSSRSIAFDNGSVNFTPSGGWATLADNPNARGGTYLGTPASIGSATQAVTVAPATDIPDGSYEIQMYVGGDVTLPPVAYAQQAQYEVFIGGVSQGRFLINLAGPAGWVRIGDKRYAHSSTLPITVVMENRSDAAGDTGKRVYVDQFRFVGSAAAEFTSTPIHATARIRLTPGGVPVDTNVVIAADEQGRIHCLDAAGNGDGTTTCYWTYPSERTAALDPNLEQGQDANDPNILGGYQKFDGEFDTLKAGMPANFELSTAVVQRLNITQPTLPVPTVVQRDFLVIGSTNGRVFSIAMEGRGDFNNASNVHGTTFRSWTYPETFPATPEQSTQLGAITSVVQATALVGGVSRPVVFVGTEQGRMYCLDAAGDFNYAGNNELKTSVLWQYPGANSETLGAISGAPVYDATNNRLFFGTEMVGDQPGTMVSINVDTGVPIWTDITDTLPGTVPNRLDWYSGAAYVSQTEITSLPGSVTALSTPNMLFGMNENGYVYGINADTGAVLWRTNELQSGGVGSIIYSNIRTQDAATGALTDYPVIFVPTSGGRFAALFCRLGEETRFGNRVAWGYTMNDAVHASMTVSNKWLFGASANGFLFAWSDYANAGSTIGGGIVPPGYDNVPDNNRDPLYEDYRNAECAFLSKEGYVRLRKALPGGAKGVELYNTVIDNAAAYVSPYGKVRPPFRSTHGPAFEWGETIYLVVYNFPVRTLDTNGDDVPPPIVEAIVTTEGRPGRPIAAEARLFADKDETDGDGGYAIYQIPLTTNGNTSQVPGPGSIRVQIKTSATNRNGTMQSISLNPAVTNISYQVANPLAIRVAAGDTNQLGYTIDPTREDALANGSKNLTVTGIGAVNGAQFGSSVGIASHGGSKRVNVEVTDRSLVTLQRGEGRGIDNIRVDRRDLRWQGGTASIVKPFSAMPASVVSLFANFEDLPNRFPNVSLDYPDVRRENVRVRKDPNGNVENPVFNGVSLKGPRDGAGLPVDESTAASRVLQPTSFEFQVEVPKYQPTNLGANSIPNQAGSTSWFAGYAGRFTVFIDSDNDNRFTGSSKEANRSFNLAAAVAPDTKIVIGTPNVELGSLAAGAGYDTRLTYSATAPYRTLNLSSFFNPASTEYSDMFKSFTAFNEGNVNLLNVRLAKGTAEVGGGGITRYWPWQLLSLGNNDQVWLDSATDVHSDLDTHFAPELGASGLNYVVIQKPRVGDKQGRQLKVNPSSRLNPNLPAAGGLLQPLLGTLNRDAKIAVTPPIGTPVGRYSQTMRLIEDIGQLGIGGFNDESISLGYTTSGSMNLFEAYSDPTFQVSFTIKETQLTGGNSKFTDTLISEPTTVDSVAPAQWSDIQPTGVRRNDGSVTMAFASNRPTDYPAIGNPNPNNKSFGIWISLLNGGVMGAPDARGEDSWLRDLNKFAPNDPGNRRWAAFTGFIPAAFITNATFPGTLTTGVPGTGASIGGSIIPSQNRLSHPSLPTGGDKDLTGASMNQLALAMVGETKRQTASGPVSDSRLMMMEVDAAGTPTTPVVLDADPTLIKGRPSVVQNGTAVGVFYAGSSNGTSNIYQVLYTIGGTFTIPTQLRFGKGFESVSDPSAVLHTDASGNPEVLLTFSGRLRGSSVTEVFTTKLAVDPATLAVLNTNTYFGQPNTAGGSLVESITFDSKFNGFRARGTNWAGTFTLRSGAGVSVFADGTGAPTDTPVQTLDRETGLLSYPTIFGGRVTVDPALGLIRFTSSQLPKSTQLVLSYVPTQLRLSGTSNSGYSAPSALFDGRLMPSNTATTPALWFTPSGAVEPSASANTLADRLLLTAVRGAASGGQTSRPVMTSFRYGVRVGRTILVNSNGTLGEPVTVSGNVGSYQIDAAAGRIYFTHLDDNRIVRIQIGSGVNAIDISRPVSMVGETAEEFVPMESALNEANMALFLDPRGDVNNRRELVWMIWSSMRKGAPSLFFQTMARKITPHLPN